MAKKRKNSESPAVPDAGNARYDAATVPPPAPNKRPARPAGDYDVDDDNLDEDYTDDEDEIDEVGPFITPEFPPEVVANDDPELQAFLRTMVAQAAVSPPLADWLRELGDSRDDAIQELCAPRLVLPAAGHSTLEPFTLVASGQWYARLTQCRVFARAYKGTALHGFLSVYGKPEAVRVHYAGGPTLLDAVEGCRLDLVLRLFGVKAEELAAPVDDLPRSRVGRLLRSLRRVRRRAVPRVCRVIRAEPELGRALLDALSKDRNDRSLWAMVMDELNPDWRDGVAFPTAP